MPPLWLLVTVLWVLGPLTALVLFDLLQRYCVPQRRDARRDFDRWETEMWT